MNEAYSVLVKLSLQNQVSSGLLMLSNQFVGLEGHVKKFKAELLSIRGLTMVGLGTAGAGMFGVSILAKALKPAEEYAHQLNIMKMAGLSQVDIANAIGDAWKNTSTVITTSATDNLKTLLDMRNVIGSMSEARLALPVVTQMQAVLMSSKEGKAAGQDKDFAFSVAKALDIIGATKNKTEFMKEADMMSKVVTAFQGRVTPKMFQGTFAIARQARYAMNDEFKYEILPTMMMEYAQSGNSGGGGSKGVGPMLAAMYRFTNQGYVNKKALPELISLGLVKAGTALQTTTSGTTVGAMKDYQLAGQNPFKWVQDILVPAIRQRYGHGEKKDLTRDELQFHINQLTRGNQLLGAGFVEFATKSYAFYRDQNIIRNAMAPTQAYQQAMLNDPQLARNELQKQWENVQIALTTPLVTILIPTLSKLALGLNTFGKVLEEYPSLAKALTYSFLTLSATLLFSGIVLLLNSALRSLVITFNILKIISSPLTMGFRQLAVSMGIMELVAAPVLIVFAGIASAIGIFVYDGYQLYQTIKSINFSHLVTEIKSLWSNLNFGYGNSSQKSINAKTNPVFVRKANQANDATHVHINLDGHKIAHVVANNISKQAFNVPNTGSTFDTGMSPMPSIFNALGIAG